MKAIVVGVILLAVLAITIGCIMVLDAYQIKASTMRRIEQVELTSIAKEYFKNMITDSNVEYELNRRVKEAAGDATAVTTSITYRDKEKGVISFQVTMTYKQTSGKTRTLTTKKTFIMERDENYTYSYVRAIKSDYLYTIPADSIWKDSAYSTALNAALAANA